MYLIHIDVWSHWSQDVTLHHAGSSAISKFATTARGENWRRLFSSIKFVPFEVSWLDMWWHSVNLSQLLANSELSPLLSCLFFIFCWCRTLFLVYNVSLTQKKQRRGNIEHSLSHFWFALFLFHCHQLVGPLPGKISFSVELKHVLKFHQFHVALQP